MQRAYSRASWGMHRAEIRDKDAASSPYVGFQIPSPRAESLGSYILNLPSYYNNLMDFFLMLLITFTWICSSRSWGETLCDSFSFQKAFIFQARSNTQVLLHKSAGTEIRKCSDSFLSELRREGNVFFPKPNRMPTDKAVKDAPSCFATENMVQTTAVTWLEVAFLTHPRRERLSTLQENHWEPKQRGSQDLIY